MMKNWHIGKNILLSDHENMVSTFTGVHEFREDGGFRIWYSRAHLREIKFNFGYLDVDAELNILNDTVAQISTEPYKSGLHILGIPTDWQLFQPVCIKLDNGCERIYFWAHSKDSVHRYFAAESTDGINFYVRDHRRPLFYHPNDRAVPFDELKHSELTIYCNREFSPVPDEPAATADLLMNDATNVYRLEDGSFELYAAQVFTRNVLPGKKTPREPYFRTIQRRTSPDGLHWSKPQVVLKPDEQDDYDLQFYYLSVTHTPEGRIGLLGHYHSDPGVMDIEFCYSADGIQWTRERIPDFPRPAEVGMVVAPHCLLKKEDKYFMFYTCDLINHRGEYVDKFASPDTPLSRIDYAELSCSEVPIKF